MGIGVRGGFVGGCIRVRGVEMVWGQCVGIGVEIAIGPVFRRRIISEGETEI